MVDGGGREMDSPRFRAILRATSGRRKRAPEVKSFSHELGSRGAVCGGGGRCVVPAMHKMVRGGGVGSTTPEEFIGAIRTKFIRLKEEVDSELGVFAADLVDVLARAGDSEGEGDGEDHHTADDWRAALEDLLVVAQRCAGMSPEELWTRCEGVVQALEDRRQELPAGLPKQAHTRVLFILTRCTRLLQFRKGAAVGGCRYADVDSNVLGLHQLSDLGLYPIHVDSGDLGRKSTSSLTELKERLIRRRCWREQVKAHPFFKDINWDMLARQKVAFIPSTDDEYDTSYFACRHAWGTADEQVNAAGNDYDDRSETSSMSCGSSPHSDYEEDGDECGSMEEFGAPLSVKYSFSNFSFKNISQLASMNYDLMTKHKLDPVQSSKS